MNANVIKRKPIVLSNLFSYSFIDNFTIKLTLKSHEDYRAVIKIVCKLAVDLKDYDSLTKVKQRFEEGLIDFFSVTTSLKENENTDSYDTTGISNDVLLLDISELERILIDISKKHEQFNINKRLSLIEIKHPIRKKSNFVQRWGKGI